MKKLSVFLFFLLMLVFLTGCATVTKEPLGLPSDIGNPSNIEDPLGLPSDIGTPNDITGNFFMDPEGLPSNIGMP